MPFASSSPRMASSTSPIRSLLRPEAGIRARYFSSISSQEMPRGPEPQRGVDHAGVGLARLELDRHATAVGPLQGRHAVSLALTPKRFAVATQARRKIVMTVAWKPREGSVDV